MAGIFIFLLLGLVVGLIVVASNPSPYFAALGLVMVAGFGCGVLLGHGGAFLPLVLLLIYLGGMLVVFAYCAALAAEPYPESLGSRPVTGAALLYGFVVVMSGVYFRGMWDEFSWLTVEEADDFSVFRGDMEGIAVIYSSGAGPLLISAGALLLTLFVVLELTRGLSRGALRAV
uniref:NADH-ubiquinone oxidoreductase chain 6 n=1 Tax=Pentapodus setosus TaxID=490272 RepID=A0A6S6ME32_9TELE|nr:NADH dehydrogenase subunit 6 [Pentapodus setosus]BCG62292.1 NADH dehydrogenase subunit 6 [Pentapodus setosus]